MFQESVKKIQNNPYIDRLSFIDFDRETDEFLMSLKEQVSQILSSQSELDYKSGTAKVFKENLLASKAECYCQELSFHARLNFDLFVLTLTILEDFYLGLYNIKQIKSFEDINWQQMYGIVDVLEGAIYRIRQIQSIAKNNNIIINFDYYNIIVKALKDIFVICLTQVSDRAEEIAEYHNEQVAVRRTVLSALCLIDWIEADSNDLATYELVQPKLQEIKVNPQPQKQSPQTQRLLAYMDEWAKEEPEAEPNIEICERFTGF
ncbi:MAG: hypothetical protein SAJ12_22970 [Jaaginema sp. PMC 1079.18]|nr:hypothetical protein [Jaaginema sp. PMC 1080.18]MEC4853853.1 hypothetical protein [Jaaginema sp. PMC 1079.18]